MKIGCLPDASTYDAETCRAKARSIGPRLAGSRRLVPPGHCSETALLVRCFERVWRVASVPAVFSGEAHGECSSCWRVRSRAAVQVAPVNEAAGEAARSAA